MAMPIQAHKIVINSKLRFPHFSPTIRRSSWFASFPTNHGDKWSMSLSAYNSQLTQPDGSMTRPLADFPPSIWADRFASFTFNHLEITSYEVEELTKEVRKMISTSYTSGPMETIKLIDTLYRLGVSYHFEDEIEKHLNDIYNYLDDIINEANYDLYTAGILFQVFRRHGYKLSCDVFNKFKDNNGKFKTTLCTDVKGMLSLNEATYLGVKGEDILDEALHFTTIHLKSFATQKTSHQFSRRILYSLKQPFHKGIRRVETQKFISFYEEDSSKNETLSRFAKLDFNRVQKLHQHELSLVTSWWNDLKLATKLPYIRDRLVETYFIAVAISFEPRYSLSRVMTTKMIMMLSIIDDTYDAYGIMDELQQFTNAIERWDIAAIDQLPEYMKIIYKEVLKLYDQCETEVIKEGKSYTMGYAKDEMKKIVRGYHIGAQWSSEGYVPMFEEYMKHYGQITCGIYFMSASWFIGMRDKVGTKEFEWLLDTNKPKIITIAEHVGRYMDDIASHETEEKRNVLSGVPCYMKEYGVSKEETFKKFREGIINGWKDMNEEYMSPTPVSKSIITLVINLIRFGEVIYHNGIDGYTDCKYLKDVIVDLLIDPISL